MSREDRRRWEERWAGAPSAPGEPSAFVLEHLDLLPAGRVLDLASGDGRHAAMLAVGGRAVVAVDVARTALERLRRRSPATRAVLMDLDEPGFRPASVDAILCSSFLDRKLFELAATWLRPGGVLLADTFVEPDGDAADLHAPRNPAFVLRPNELAERLLPSFRLLRYREGLVRRDGGEGSFRASAVARRR